MSSFDLPYYFADFTPVPGTIKTRYEDFKVIEVPAYEPFGEGDHTYFQIEKMGIPTMRAVRDIARALNVKPVQIGYAGMKDARAVTRQMMSVEHVKPEVILGLNLSKIKVLWVNKHRNKLKLGHLKRNTFVIKLRDTDVSRLADVQDMLKIMEEKGVPNYFGPQRFGVRGDTWKVGAALIRGDFKLAADSIAGKASNEDS